MSLRIAIRNKNMWTIQTSLEYRQLLKNRWNIQDDPISQSDLIPERQMIMTMLFMMMMMIIISIQIINVQLN